MGKRNGEESAVTAPGKALQAERRASPGPEELVCMSQEQKGQLGGAGEQWNAGGFQGSRTHRAGIKS